MFGRFPIFEQHLFVSQVVEFADRGVSAKGLREQFRSFGILHCKLGECLLGRCDQLFQGGVELRQRWIGDGLDQAVSDERTQDFLYLVCSVCASVVENGIAIVLGRGLQLIGEFLYSVSCVSGEVFAMGACSARKAKNEFAALEEDMGQTWS